MSMDKAGAMDPALLEQAADWAMLLTYGEATEQQRQALASWLRQSPAHEAAWARAQAVLGTFSQACNGVGRDTWKALKRDGRRRTLRALLAGLVVLPAGWLAWQQRPWLPWTADLATATGEIRSLTLDDGSRLTLNTASAVSLAFTETERRIDLLAGEILVTTQPDPHPRPRPFRVHTPEGSVRALGTRFSVRRLGEATRSAVFEEAVEIRPADGPALILGAGQQTTFKRDGIASPQGVDAAAAAWEQGMLVARDMRLADVVAELDRYRLGLLRCDPAIAGLRVSGVISLRDTDAGLDALAHTLPLRIQRHSRYWVDIQAL